MTRVVWTRPARDDVREVRDFIARDSAQYARAVAEGRDWPASDTPRRAAVNSLGVGGTNAHVIVEEAPPREPVAASPEWRLFPFSARTPAALERMRDHWKGFISDAAPAVASDPAANAVPVRAARTPLRARGQVLLDTDVPPR